MSNLSLERLLFDPAVPTEGPLIGSYLLGAGGTVLGSVSDALKVNITNASLVVTATDLDIRNLAFATDSVTVHIDGTDNVISAVNLDIRDLAFATDSVTAYQGGTWTVTTSELPNIVPLSSAVTVDDTVGGTALPATPLVGRKRLQIQNNGDKDIFLGKSGVTVSSGLKIAKGGTESVEAGPAALFYAIAGTGNSVNVRLLEW